MSQQPNVQRSTEKKIKMKQPFFRQNTSSVAYRFVRVLIISLQSEGYDIAFSWARCESLVVPPRQRYSMSTNLIPCICAFILFQRKSYLYQVQSTVDSTSFFSE